MSVQKTVSDLSILFDSRKSWGLLFAIATATGIFCTSDPLADISISVLVLTPLSTFAIIIGMYVFNDIVDLQIDIDNKKFHRPLPSGDVNLHNAVMFVVIMNIIGITIASINSTVIPTLVIVAIGVLYSLPGPSLKDRSVLKTLAIASTMMFALLVGATATNDLVPYSVFAGLMLFMMVFVTSPINDIADIKGDLIAGRKTIPILIGSRNTMILSSGVVGLMFVLSWIIDIIWVSIPVSMVLVLTMLNIIQLYRNRDCISRSVISRSIPLHLALQLALVIGWLGVTYTTVF